MDDVDFGSLSANLKTSDLMGCDSSFANIFLYQQKYNTQLKIQNNVLLRYNNTCSGSTYFAFPIPLLQASPDFLKITLDYIINHFQKPFFHLITKVQQQKLDDCLKENFPNHHIEWETDRADTDYVYLQSDLADLSGKILQKKKNHINQFMKIYENRWTFKTFPQNSVADDILQIEENWFNEKNGQTNDDLKAERQIIKNALKNAEMLKLSGAVLYVDEKPVAMTLASPISSSVLDIHFEKAIGEYAKNGGYAVINNFFAKTCPEFKYFNREEDLGIEGLRKAKLSYKPEILLNKYSGQIL